MRVCAQKQKLAMTRKKPQRVYTLLTCCCCWIVRICPVEDDDEKAAVGADANEPVEVEPSDEGAS